MSKHNPRARYLTTTEMQALVDRGAYRYDGKYAVSVARGPAYLYQQFGATCGAWEKVSSGEVGQQ